MEPQDQSQSQQSDRLSGLARITQSNIAYHIEYWLNRYWSRMFSTNSIFSKWLVDSWQFGCVESWQILTGHLSQQRLDIVFFGGKTDALDHSSGYRRLNTNILNLSRQCMVCSNWKSQWHSPYILVHFLHCFVQNATARTNRWSITKQQAKPKTNETDIFKILQHGMELVQNSSWAWDWERRHAISKMIKHVHAWTTIRRFSWLQYLDSLCGFARSLPSLASWSSPLRYVAPWYHVLPRGIMWYLWNKVCLDVSNDVIDVLIWLLPTN